VLTNAEITAETTFPFEIWVRGTSSRVDQNAAEVTLAYARQQVLHPVRACVPGMLGDRPTGHRGSPAISPSRNARARRRGSTRPNRPPIRPINSSSPALPSEGIITLYAVARSHRAILLCPHNQDPRAVAASHPGPPRCKIPNSGWSIRVNGRGRFCGLLTLAGLAVRTGQPRGQSFAQFPSIRRLQAQAAGQVRRSRGAVPYR
jgi:hypothetical protein